MRLCGHVVSVVSPPSAGSGAPFRGGWTPGRRGGHLVIVAVVQAEVCRGCALSCSAPVEPELSPSVVDKDYNMPSAGL